MPKQKTHKGLKKRVKITATGKVSRRKSFSGHLMSKKSGSRKQGLRQAKLLVGRIADAARRAVGAD